MLHNADILDTNINMLIITPKEDNKIFRHETHVDHVLSGSAKIPTA